MKLLDLFCCCGGISEGFARNGFECTGVDITDDHNYRHEFIHSNVFKLPLQFLQKFDVIHASPPCQHYSWGSSLAKIRTGKTYPDLVDRTRELLIRTGRPFLMENVIGAPLRKDIVLCGTMFGLRVVRHRIFEIHGFTVLQPPHDKHKEPWVDDNGRKKSYYASVAGHGGHGYSYVFENWKRDMGIEWVNDKTHLTQMIPPAYAEYISRFLQTD